MSRNLVQAVADICRCCRHLCLTPMQVAQSPDTFDEVQWRVLPPLQYVAAKDFEANAKHLLHSENAIREENVWSDIERRQDAETVEALAVW